ncbi:hypothetical protein SeMB42_g02045 [Synchytrium endobioticum]|uniref:Uncharacterized protein n=1 Tax=Synchytrium endobioticum TaxID=286115 RepID=A0A507D1C5_9FUNG|nr:hypothetical protein SeLEV6574_g03970 [Synchytrium endobioticum]TPX51023.1 hypothetical protein SeMB42_g02045 [Synchytrium endobioticum]
MLNRLTDLVSDILAPIKTTDTVFREHWDHVQLCYKRGHAQSHLSISDTNLPYHLEAMVRYLKEEQTEWSYAAPLALESPSSLHAGPCLEYLLGNRILHELVAYAQSDTPIGMRAHVLRIFQLLIANLGGPKLLPETAVRAPLTKLLADCHQLADEATPSPSPNPPSGSASQVKHELVQLLALIFRHIRSTPSLLGLLFDRDASKAPQFGIFDTLMDYIGYPSTTGHVAREAVLCAIDVISDDAVLQQDDRNRELMVDVIDYIANASHLPETVAERLALLYARMASSAPSARADGKNKRTVPQSPCPSPLPMTTNIYSDATAGMPNTLNATDEFHDLWSFANKIINCDCHKLTNRLVDTIDATFFRPTLFQSLASATQHVAVSATLYLSELIRHVTPELLACLSLGLATHRVADAHGQRKLLDVMLSRLEQLSGDHVAISTLRLFDVIISTYQPQVLHVLLHVDGSGCEIPVATDRQTHNLHARIERLLSSLPPAGIPTNPDDIFNSGYDEHFELAHRRVLDYLQKREGWRRTSLVGGPNTEDHGAINLRRIILRLLPQMLDLSPGLNLVLTSCISRIATMGGRDVDKFLFGGSEDGGCVADILSRLSHAAQQQLSSVDHAVVKLAAMRERGIDGTQAAAKLGEIPRVIDNGGHANGPLPVPPHAPARPEAHLLAAYLILSEFIKELAAIVLNSSFSINDMDNNGTARDSVPDNNDQGWGAVDARQLRAVAGPDASSPFTQMLLPAAEMESLASEGAKVIGATIAHSLEAFKKAWGAGSGASEETRSP